MNKLFALLKRYWPIVAFALVYLFIFRKVFLSNLVPFPGDLLVTRFFPYAGGGWEGYSPWITNKEFILADVVRQLFPWKVLSMDLIKQGVFPLWNIYSFAGNPLLANLQSAALYPLNIVFLFLRPEFAWILFIMLQPILSTLFMFMFIRSLKLSKLSAIFAGIAFSFIGYIVVWFEMGNIGHAALWLPFILWGMTKFIEENRLRFMAFSAFGLACSILAGHAQTTAYVLLFSLAYFLYMGYPKLSKKQIFIGLAVLLLGISLAAIQIFPSLELMSASPRDAISSTRTYHKFITPWSHAVMMLAPDFFGNPAVGNFWGKDYGEFMSYFGVITLLVAAIGFYTHIKNRLMKLLLGVSFVSFLIAFPTPFPELLFRANIPILSTGLPARTMFLFAFSFVIAGAYGIEAILTMKQKKILPPIVGVLCLYVSMWLIIFVIPIDPLKLAVTKRNIILPTAIVFFVSALIIWKKYLPRALMLWIVIFACMGFEYSYFLNKYLPIASSTYMFPQHEFIDKLSEIQGSDRAYGYESGRLDTNLFVQWRVMSPEGYDPLYIKRYSELMHAAKTGKLEVDLPRSDALLPESLPNEDSHRKQVILNLLGVRYILDNDGVASSDWDPRPDRFPESRFQLLHQINKRKIYENKNVLPRAAIFHDFAVVQNNSALISKLFDPSFAYNHTLLLEETPSILPKPLPITPAKITSYSSNSIIIDTNATESGMLFLSDNHYPGWEATIDDQPVPILKADYSFRAVELPKGPHRVAFEYKPRSFYIGSIISFVSFLVLGVFLKKNVKV